MSVANIVQTRRFDCGKHECNFVFADCPFCKIESLERELSRYRDPAMVLVNRADLESVAKDLQELVCALFNRIRSERAFDKFSGIADRAHDKTRAMIAAGEGK